MTSTQAHGGAARAAKLSPARRTAIAAKAAQARWARPLRPASKMDVARVEVALDVLRGALFQLTEAGCPKAAAKVRQAITSTDGALRHARRRLAAQETNRG